MAEQGWSGKLREVARELEAAAEKLEGRQGAGEEAEDKLPLEKLGTVLAEAQRHLAEIQRTLPRPEAEEPSILVVDDDSVSRELLADFLGRYGATRAVSSGAEAVNVITRAIRSGRPYRLVFLDIMMPEMDGHEVLRRIRSLEEVYSVRSPAVVATTTARGDRESVLRARSLGSEAYFIKPLDLAKLGQWIDSLKLGTEQAGT